jgi:fibronectin-binding autotransporter adhesin
MKKHRSSKRFSRPAKPLGLGLKVSVTALLALCTQSAQAASATWNASPTTSVWEATGTESNWLTGIATFPGDISGGVTNTDVATFFGIGNTTTLAINATAENTTPLNIAGIIFSGPDKSAYTIGSTTGNPLWLSSGASNQIVISGASSSGTGNTQTVNSPLVLQPATATSAGTYQFQNNASGTTAATDVLIIAGSVTGGTTTQGIALTVRGANTNTTNVVSGNITNGGAAQGISLAKLDAGTWTLGGANAYTGATSVGGGILAITGSNTGGGSYSVSVGTLTLNPSGTVNASSIAFAGPNTTVNVNGGTVVVSGSVTTAQSASRSTNLNGGIFQVATNLYTAAAASDLKFNGGTLKSGTVGGLAVDGANFNSTHTVTVLAGGATLDTAIGNITSTAVFNGTNSGAITVKGGNTFKSNITSNGLLTLQDNSTWDIGGTGGASAVFLSSSVAGLSGNGTVSNSSATDGTLTTNFANTVGPFTYSGNIAPATASRIALTKNGTGTQILTGANTYSGATTITAGTLQVGAGGTTGTLSADSAISIAAGASLVFNRNNSVTQGTHFSAAAITGAGSLTQAGTSTLTLNTNNAYSGTTTIAAGIISASATRALGLGTVDISGGGTLQLSNDITLTNLLKTAGESAASASSGKIVSTGNNTVTGNIDFGNFGGLFTNIISTSGTLSLSGGISTTLGSGRTINFGGAGDTTSTGVIADGTSTVSVSKLGGGTLILSGANTYTGNTTVSGGTLLAGASNALGAGNLVLSGGALSSTVANLDIAGNVTLSAGGSLALNTTAAGSLTLAADKNFTMPVGTWSLSLTDAASYDKVIGSGAGTFAISDCTIALTSGVPDYQAAYTIFSGFASGTVSNVTISGYDTTNYVANLSNSGVLTFTSLTPTDGFATWQAGITWNGADSSAAADADADGQSNLLEYALGSNPVSASSTGAITSAVASNRLTLSFNRIADPALTYAVQASSDLTTSWTQIWSSTGVANTAAPVTVTDTQDLTARRFLRLVVTH